MASRETVKNMRKIYKLQAIGGSYYIALPKDWLKRFNLGKGSHVEILVEPDGALKIKPLEGFVEASEEEARSRIDVEVKDKDYVYPLLLWLYLAGYDVIVLRFRDSSIGSAIRGAVNKAKNILLGFEIVDENGTSITLNVLASSDTDVYTIVKNMNRIARSMYYDVVVALIDRDIEKAYDVEARDQDLNRLYFYVTRTIRKKVISIADSNEMLRLLDLRMIAKSVEEIGDDAKKAAKIAQEVMLSDIELDSAKIRELKIYVDELDDIYKHIANRIGRHSPLTELIEIQRKCEKLVENLEDFRRRVISDGVKGSAYIGELAYTYSNISMHLFDIVSLMPSTI